MIQWSPAPLITANTTKSGTSGEVAWVYLNNSSEPQYIDRLQVQAAGTNAATALRIWINNGQSNSEAANNVLLEEATLASTTTSEVAEVASTSIDLNVWLPKGYRIFTSIGTAGTAGWRFTAIGKPTVTDILE